MSRFDAMYPACGPECNCGMLCKRAAAIDEHYASRLAFMMECLLVDHHGHWNAAAALLDEYKGEWDRINPRPPTFMGEPMPPERRERLASALANRKKTSGSPVAATSDVAVATPDVAPCTGVNPADVRADVRAIYAGPDDPRDSARFSWIMRAISGKALREIGVVLEPPWSLDNFRKSVDAAMALKAQT